MEEQNQQPNHPEHPEHHFLHLIAIPASIFAAVLFIGTIYWLYARYQSSLPDGIICTQEAMQCPDGSYVGRVGPNCGFAPCPTSEVGQDGLFPSCEDIDIPQKEIDRVVAEAFSTGRYDNVWSDAKQWGELVVYVEQELGCTIDLERALNGDTSNWKTYRNEQYGFEVRYPPTWEVTDRAVLHKYLAALTIWEPNEIEKISEIGFFDSSRSQRTNFAELEIYSVYANVLENYLRPFEKIFLPNKESLFVAGIEAIEFDMKVGGQDFMTRHVLIKENGRAYLFAISLGDSAYQMTEGEINERLQKSYEVIDSFAFSADVLDWKTYRNEQYGFEVRYPDNMEVSEPIAGELKFGVLFQEKKYRGIIEGEIPGLVITNYAYGMVGDETRIFNKASIEDGNTIPIHFKEKNREMFSKCLLYNLSGSEVDGFISTCNQILSTFKFIE